MKKFIFIAGALLFLGACGNQAEPAPRLEVADVTLPDTYDEVRAQADYKRYCSSCHGGNLQGAPAYQYPINNFSKEEVYIAIVQGVGRMPAGLVKGEDAENLAVWIADQ